MIKSFVISAVKRVAVAGSLAFVGLLGLASDEARAGQVANISTGVDAAGTPLADGAIDTRYQLTTSADPSFPGPDTYVVNQGGFPFPYWYADTAASKWIAPYADANRTSPSGTYVYTTTFNLTGFDIASAVISGLWATDNEGLDIKINGVSTGFSTSGTSYSSPSAFSITSGFVTGLNTLEFFVNNQSQSSGNPTGLRVEGLVSATAVPEPSTVASAVAGGLAAMGYAVRRRRRA